MPTMPTELEAQIAAVRVHVQAALDIVAQADDAGLETDALTLWAKAVQVAAEAAEKAAADADTLGEALAETIVRVQAEAAWWATERASEVLADLEADAEEQEDNDD
jgi:hypothetical protein